MDRNLLPIHRTGWRGGVNVNTLGKLSIASLRLVGFGKSSALKHIFLLCKLWCSLIHVVETSLTAHEGLQVYNIGPNYWLWTGMAINEPCTWHITFFRSIKDLQDSHIFNVKYWNKKNRKIRWCSNWIFRINVD